MTDQNAIYPDEESRLHTADSEPALLQPRRADAEPPKPERPPVTEKASRKSLLAEEAQTLSEIIASLGGATAGRLKLCVQRNVRGVGWKSLRAVQIEEWMIDNGLDVSEVVGEAYGDGFYRWQLRYAGRFLRKGDCHLEGYEHVRDDAIPPPDDEDVQQLDLGQVLEQLRREVREEIRAASAAPQTLSGQGDQLKAVMEPLMRFLESKFPGQPTKPQGPDPTVTALIGMMAQQTNTFMQVMAQGMTHAPAAAQPTLTENVRVLKEIMEVAKGLTAPQFMPYEEAFEDAAPELPAPSPDQPAQPQGNPIMEQLGKTVNGAVNRLLTNLVQVGEEKLAEQVSQMAGAQQAPAQSAAQTAQNNLAQTAESPAAGNATQEIEVLCDALGHCITHQIPPERLAKELASSYPPETLQQLTVEGITAAQIADGLAVMGKPELAQKLREPAYAAYLENLLKALRERPSGA